MSTPAVVLEAARERRRRFATNNLLVDRVRDGDRGRRASSRSSARCSRRTTRTPRTSPTRTSARWPATPLGFDSQGRDLLSRLLTGARTSIAGPFLVVLVSMLAGSVLAVTAAWAGRWVDASISTVLDILFAFPAILLAVLAAAVFGAGLTAPTLALAIAYTPYIARVLRGAALRERAREYVDACEVQGLSASTICARHLMPNLMPLIVAQATLLFGYAMVDFAAISFIGLGVQPPTGRLGRDGRERPGGRPAGLPAGVPHRRALHRGRGRGGQPTRRATRRGQRGTMSDDLHYLPATEALARFRDRSLSPVELLDAVIARAEAVEPTVNALCHERYEAAREEARAAEARWAGRGDGEPRALEGIPLAIKEEEEVAGQPWTQGSLIYKDLVAEQSSPFAQRMLDAGAIVHARTTAPSSPARCSPTRGCTA